MRSAVLALLLCVGLASCTIQQQGTQGSSERSVGERGGGPTPVLPSLAPDAKLQWRAGPGLPTPRTEVAATAIANQVFVAGGFTGDGKASDVVEVYNPGRNVWEKVPSLPKRLHHAALASTGGVMYLIGGFTEDGKASREVWSMPPGGSQWLKVASLPTARGALAAAVVEGRIHVVGGATAFGPGAKLSGEHVFYDVTDAVWKRAASLPDPRDHLAAAGAGLTLVVVGGRKLSMETNSARVDLYDTDAQRWRKGTLMPTARGGLSAAPWNGRVFVVGGEQPSGTFAAVEWYDPGSDAWFKAPNLPTPRHGLAAVSFEAGELIVVGGGPRPGLSVSGALEFLSVVE